MRKIAMLMAGTVAFATVAAPALAVPTLANSAGGDGFVTIGPAPVLFTLFGSDSGVEDNIATYSDVATTAKTYYYNFTYHTDDVDGAGLDPAGYFINSNFFQLSPASSPTNFTSSGHFSFTVAPGDSFGVYVNSTDGILGRGSIALAVPEPASWALLITGFGLVGMAARRRRTAVAV